MQNIISRTVSGAIYQSQYALPGVVAHAEPLGLAHIDPDDFAVHIADAILGRENHDKAKVDLKTARAALKANMKAARLFVRVARETLKAFLGETATGAFALAGFDGSFEIPTNAEEMVQLLQRLKAHFIANPTHETPGLNVSGNRAGTLATDVMNSAIAVGQKLNLVTTTKDIRDGKIGVLVNDMSNLISELHVTIDPLSGLWPEFGLKKPGALHIPTVPLNVTAVLIGANAAAVKWDKAERAENYRIYKRVVGVDADWVYVDTRADLDCTIEGLPAGATVEIAVSASNNGGESLKSAVATIVTAT